MHAACPWLDVVAAVDINQDSRLVYARNFSTPYWIRELETIPLEWLASHDADLWWMSPPCTPFTRKGARRDLLDMRTRSLIHLIDAVRKIQPPIVVLENVVGFEVSLTYSRLANDWRDAGYFVQSIMLCPSELGWPNRRPRIYVIASQQPISLAGPTIAFRKALKDLLPCDLVEVNRPEFMIAPDTATRYRLALDIVDPNEDPSAIAASFGASYGRVLTRSGSYLKTELGLRRFSPREVASILGFPLNFELPDQLSPGRLWHLLGNSLSLPAVSHVMEFTRR
jgi:site-specific DNA-cytosine methylase